MQNSPRTLKEGLVRLEKHIASLGLASRREAKDLILKGKVLVNGKVNKNTGFGVDVSKDKVTVGTEKKEYILLYKPRGVETNRTADIQDIHDVFPKFKHLSPIGRLDAESEGLILLSNDGTLAKALTQKDSKVGKTYRVTVRESIKESDIRTMSTGIALDGVKTKPCEVRKVKNNVFTIVLHEGRKHQIRRMCAFVHLTVEELVRVAIGGIEIGNMRSGESRGLSKGDVDRLKS